MSENFPFKENSGTKQSDLNRGYSDALLPSEDPNKPWESIFVMPGDVEEPEFGFLGRRGNTWER